MRWRRRTCREFGFNFPSAGSCSEGSSDEEIVFDKSVMERNKESSKDASPRTTTEASSGRSQSASPSYQSPDHPTQEQKIWTLTDTPTSTPLIAVPTLDDANRTDVCTVTGIPETKSLDSSFKPSSVTSDLSIGKPTETPRSVSLTSVSRISLASETDICDPDLAIETRSSAPTCNLLDKTFPGSPPFTTEASLGPSTSSEQTTSESLLSPHPSKSSSSLLPTAPEESAQTVSMAPDSKSSSESCKTPIATRNEVVITMDDEGKIPYTSDKSQGKLLSAVKDAGKESNKQDVVITMGLYDDVKSSARLETESSLGEVIYTSQKAEIKNVTTGDAIIDVMGSDNDNGETSVINGKSNEGKLIRSRR